MICHALGIRRLALGRWLPRARAVGPPRSKEALILQSLPTRHHFDKDAPEELAESIKANGGCSHVVSGRGGQIPDSGERALPGQLAGDHGSAIARLRPAGAEMTVVETCSVGPELHERRRYGKLSRISIDPGADGQRVGIRGSRSEPMRLLAAQVR
jgi:hypothetical protein